MVWVISAQSQRRYTLSLKKFWEESGNECQRLPSISHTCSMGFETSDCDDHSMGSNVSDSNVLVDNASSVNSKLMVHRNRIRAHSCMKWANILSKDAHYDVEINLCRVTVPQGKMLTAIPAKTTKPPSLYACNSRILVVWYKVSGILQFYIRWESIYRLNRNLSLKSPGPIVIVISLQASAASSFLRSRL